MDNSNRLIGMADIAAAIGEARMGYIEQMPDAAILRERTGCSVEMAEQLIALHREYTQHQVREAMRARNRVIRKMLEGATARLRDRFGRGGEQIGICRPEAHGDPNDLDTLWTYPVVADDGMVLYYIDAHGAGFALTGSDHVPVEVTITEDAARRC